MNKDVSDKPLLQDGAPQEDSVPREQGEMHLFDHLAELRKRLMYSLLAVFIGAVIAFGFSQELFALLSEPFTKGLEGPGLIGTGPAEAFLLRLKISIFAGALLVAPYVFYQFWLFVAPGLYDEEKQAVVPFLTATTLLLLIGVLFCYEVVLPFAFDFFFEQYEVIGVTPTIRISEHLELVLKALLGFGLVFEFPVLAYFLARFGIITDRMMIEGTRYAIVIIFLVAAFLTPPDVLTQFLMAIPLLILYGLSILVVRWAQPKD